MSCRCMQIAEGSFYLFSVFLYANVPFWIGTSADDRVILYIINY